MIDLQVFRCSQVDFGFDSSAIAKRQTFMDEDDLGEDEHSEHWAERQPKRDYVETIDIYDTIADAKIDDTDKVVPHNKTGTKGEGPGRKWVFLLLLGVAIVSLIIGSTSGTIATMLMNQVFSKEETIHPVSTWSSWTDCSKSCGIGIRRRSRECPETTGNNRCSESTEDFDVCMKTACRGEWTMWSPWSPCDVTCDVGVQTRMRECLNYNETVLGSSCSGRSSEAKLCYMHLCKAAVWTPWSQWSSCSVTCDEGVQTRTRDCRNYNGTLLGSSCPGISSEAKLCKLSGCTDGGWTNWGPWGTCDRTCDGCVQTRARQCTNPVPSVLGRPCYGSTTEAQTCNMAACYAVYSSSWSSWSSCSTSCGRGFMIRTRGCSSSYHWTGCIGDFIQIQACNSYCIG